MTLQDIIDTIMAGTEAEKIAFAELILQAQGFLDKKNKDTSDAQRVIDLGIANDWFDNTIQPNIKWRNSQTPIIQFRNILDDVDMLSSLTETDAYRKQVINNKLKQARDKIKQIKTQLTQGEL